MLHCREFNIQLSKFNGNDGDYESKIKAAQLVSVAIQTDEKLSLNNTYLSERNRKVSNSYWWIFSKDITSNTWISSNDEIALIFR